MKAKLIIASPERSADLYYACHFLAPDPIIYVEIYGKKYLFLSDLEIDRGKEEATVDRIYSLSEEMRKLPPKSPLIGMIDAFFKSKKIKTVEVPAEFPALYFDALQKLSYKIEVKEGLFYSERLVKTDEEKKAIMSSIRCVEIALKEALLVLEKAKIKRDKIYDGRSLITSEYLQSMINLKLMELGCIAQGTIVASGVQGSFPHHHGSGPIYPHTPIIFDIFPYHSHTRYYADMTRTVIKGKASSDHKRMYEAVKEANQRAMDKVKAGVSTHTIHQEAVKTLETASFQTGMKNGRMQGFIHSTGHGLGLDIHEPPSVSTRKSKLQAGNVITIEPGLYYEDLGGIRIEDDVYVTSTGFERLTQFPKFFEIDKANVSF